MITVYGGGIAGAVLAKRLAAHAAVTLVDPLDYFEVPMAVPRCLVAPETAQGSIIRFAEALPTVQHLRARLSELRPDGALLIDHAGNPLQHRSDVTVLATGTRFANPLMRGRDGDAAARQALYRRFHERLSAARRILIVGGGPVGVEIAAELCDRFADKQVHLVDAGPRLLRGTSVAAATHALQWLTRRGVRVTLNERLDNVSPDHDALAGAGEARTGAGETLGYDMLLWCVGGVPNTDYMTAHYSSRLNARRQVRVQSTLQVSGEQRLFALGDITDLAENKMAWHVESQVHVAKSNILALLQARSPGRHYQARTNDPRMAVTLGRRAGAVTLPGLGTLRNGWFNRTVKAEHMLVPKFRRILLK